MADIKIAGRIKAGTADNIAGYASEILFDDEASNKTVKEKLEGKQDTLTFDNVPTEGSNNPVKSGGVYQAIQSIDVSGQISGKADKSEMSVVAGTGANADKTTITLKSGTSATVLTQHQDVSEFLREGEVFGSGDDSAASFNSYADTVWNKQQTLSESQKQQVRENIGITDLETIRSGAAAGATAIQSVSVGTTTTGAAGSSASVTNTGTATAPVLSFTIPQGAQGVKGDTVIMGSEATYTLYNTTGDAVDGAMTQQAVTRELTELAGKAGELDEIINGGTEIVKKFEAQTGAPLYATNNLEEGKTYKLNVEIGQANWVRVGFGTSNSVTAGGSGYLSIFASMTIGSYSQTIIAPNPTTYPYIVYYKGSALNSVEIVEEVATEGLISRVEELEERPVIPIVNDLTTGGTTSALSAEQGKVLKGIIDEKIDGTSEITKMFEASTGAPLYAENNLEEGVTYKLKAVLGQANWVRVGFGTTNTTTASDSGYLSIFASMVIGEYEQEFVAPDPNTYPYIVYYKASALNSVQIDYEDITLGLEERMENAEEEINGILSREEAVANIDVQQTITFSENTLLDTRTNPILCDFKQGEDVYLDVHGYDISYVNLMVREKGTTTFTVERLTQEDTTSVYLNAGDRHWFTASKNIDAIAFYAASSIVTASGTAHIRVRNKNAFFVNSQLNGKKILMFGDSITQLPLTGSTTIGKGIVEFFADITGANVVRCAIGGTKLSRYAPVTQVTNSTEASNAVQICSMVELSMTGRGDLLTAAAPYISDTYAQTIPTALAAIDMNSVDAITIFGGTNDMTANVALNNDDDTDTSTIAGAINTIVKSVHENYPHIKIFIFTPIVRYFVTNETTDTAAFVNNNWSDVYQNSINKHLYDYADEVIDVAKENHIPVCDLYRGMGWNKYSYIRYLFRKAVGKNIDGTHPRFGFDKIAQFMASFVANNW